jgi:hypothetical protein
MSGLGLPVILATVAACLIIYGGRWRAHVFYLLGLTVGVAAEIMLDLANPWQTLPILIPMTALMALFTYMSWVKWWKRRQIERKTE